MYNEKELLDKLDAVLKINEKLVEENNLLKSKSSSRDVEIGCNAVTGVTLVSQNNEIEIDVKYGEFVSLSEDDIRSLLKRNSTRKLFVNGIVYFTNEEEYKNFSLSRRVNFNDDNLIKIIDTYSEDALKDFLDLATSKKQNYDVLNILFYKIIRMNLDKKFNNLTYEKRKVIEEYFMMKMDMAERLYLRVRSLF